MANKVYYFNITYHCNNNCMFCAADLRANTTEPEMPIEELIKFLEDHHVEQSDRLIVNGGEPTMHKDFFSFLDAIQEHGAYIDLYTNGKRLGNREFAEELMQYEPMLIRIPLFGATPEVHDKLTGVPGNYHAVLSAIRNITTMRKNRKIELEVKMLLSKATVPENEGIFNTISQLLSDPKRDCFSLNPLLISECVAHQEDIFIDRYYNLMMKSIQLIETIDESPWNLKLDLIPYCAYPRQLYRFLPKVPAPKKMEYYADPLHSFQVEKDKGKQHSCAHCRLKETCNFFPENYVSFYGVDDIKPF